MGFFLKLSINVAANSAAVYGATFYIPGFTFAGDWFMLATIGFLLTVGHVIVRPILRIIAFPIILLTFGLFNFVINMAILWGVHLIIPELAMEGIMPLVWGTILFSITNAIFSRF